jgi:iron complex transport system ATP-binding protein
MSLPETALASEHIYIDDVSFSYEDKAILSSVGLSVRSGEFISIVGPNGTGKTTLLRLITHFLKAQSGEIRIASKDIKSYSPQSLAQIVAVVPQSEEIVFSYTVREMVLLGRYPHVTGFGFEREEDYRIVDETLRTTSIDHLAARKITELSGGEYHRVTIARALAQQTPILLLDEPNAHLDIKHQINLFELLTKLNMDRGTTIVCVTHDLNLAAMYSDRILILADHTIAAEGPPALVLTEENISRFFGVSTRVRLDEDGGYPVIQLIRELASTPDLRGLKFPTRSQAATN